MTSKSNSHNLVDGSIQQSLIRMTMPMIIGMIMLFTFSLVDTWFISFLGTESLTAISFTFPVTFTVMSLAIGLGIGASAVVAKYLGGLSIRKSQTGCHSNQLHLVFPCHHRCRAAVVIHGSHLSRHGRK